MEQGFGPEHYNVGIILAAMGEACGELGDLSRKRELLERSLHIMEQKFGRNHRNIAVYLVEIAKTCEQLGDEETRDRLLARATSIEEQEARQLAEPSAPQEPVQVASGWWQLRCCRRSRRC
jgi:hypothetical protein